MLVLHHGSQRSGLTPLPQRPQVDFSATVDDSLLEGLGVEKGGRKLISHEERGQVLGLLDGESYKCNAGGEGALSPPS